MDSRLVQGTLPSNQTLGQWSGPQKWKISIHFKNVNPSKPEMFKQISSTLHPAR